MSGMNGNPGPPAEERALSVFAEFLARRSRVDGPALEELCSAHSDLEPSLRSLAQKRSEVKDRPPRVAAGRIASLRRRMARRGEAAAGARSRYVLLGEVARGGMGVVLHVWDTVLERPLAMKMFDPSGIPERHKADEALARFLCEACVAAKLDHPGILPVHDLGVDLGGRAYFTMPIFEGRTLEEGFELARSRSEGWSLERALLALAKVCEVVAYAHSRGVVHRDLKPANVLVAPSGEIRVVDWGLAKLVDQPEAEHAETRKPEGSTHGGPEPTMDGTVAGTPPFMAPEQADGRLDEVSFRSDVYAIGAMLYRLLVGRGPYAPRRGREEPETTVELIRRGSPTPIPLLAPAAPPELVAISEKAMARRPEDRYADADEFQRELRVFLESKGARG